MNNEKTSEFVLNLLDVAAKSYDFPIFNNEYFHYAASRMKVFCNKNEWIIIVEVIAFSRYHEFNDILYAFGNKLKKSGTIEVEEFINKGNLLNSNDVLVQELPDIELVVRKEKINLSIEKEDILNENLIKNKNKIDAIQLLRYLCLKIPDKLFMHERDLFRTLHKDMSSFEKLIELNDWYHPDIIDDELPSDSPTFLGIAHMIETGIPNVKRRIKSNTHWTNWV